VARSIFFYTDSRALGGAEFSMLMLAANLDPARWQVTLLLDDDPGADPVAALGTEAGLAVERLAPTPQGLGGSWRARRLLGMLRHRRPALFHAHLSWPVAAKWPLAAAVAARVPSVATVQLIPAFELDRSTFWQLRLLARGVGRYVAVSRAVAAELVERFRWPAQKIAVVYNAVDLARFDAPPPASLRAPLDAGEGPLLLTLARLEPQKGLDVLLRAAAETPGAHFAIAGEGPLRSELEALAEELGIAERVHLLGRRSDVPELLAASDAFVLPSLYEGSSLAVLEAMAARRPVVSSAIPGTDELIEDGASGLLVPPGEAAALAAALRRLLDDEGLRGELARRARARVEERFSPAALASSVEAVYEELLSDARTGR
jgi:glycosyltransferase involved in cell wall biosynthesis